MDHPSSPKPQERERVSSCLPSLPLGWPKPPAQLLTLPVSSLDQRYNCVNHRVGAFPPLYWTWERWRQRISNQVVQKDRMPVSKLNFILQGCRGCTLNKDILFLPIFTQHWSPFRLLCTLQSLCNSGSPTPKVRSNGLTGCGAFQQLKCPHSHNVQE